VFESCARASMMHVIYKQKLNVFQLRCESHRVERIIFVVSTNKYIYICSATVY
jgi:hypothetical protein